MKFRRSPVKSILQRVHKAITTVAKWVLELWGRYVEALFNSLATINISAAQRNTKTQILDLLFRHPNITYQEIADIVGWTKQRVQQVTERLFTRM